ncbi:lamin tail domain-containing protein [Pseudoalteromonas sp. MMG006]|uniref:PKD domain-containing protein n=1 Tax=Pseudoalteromonas sp. MMG006 TaxID=2822683 RepID=UPI001B39B41D|nr:lamin tail domain-containing protein [Pseudoalteromonas sp. MMG006]MBQ4798288.1 lamin tail domain-containing protein [Pseudoalteromonas sp. MMG006]
MVKNNLIKYLSLLFLSLLITGCGGGGSSDSSDSSSNTAPVVTFSISSNVIVANQSFTITAQASDSDGQISSYQWQQLSGPEFTFTANGNTLTATAPSVSQDTSFSFSVAVTDNTGGTTEQVFTGTITNQNNPPTVNITGPSSALANTQVELTANAQDSDGTISSITWVQSAGDSVQFTQTDGILSFSAPNITENTTLGFSVTVIDNASSSVQASTTILITQTNNAPTISISAPEQAEQNELVTLTAEAQDSDGTIDSITWQQTNGPVVDVTQASTSISFDAPIVAQDTNITFVATVTDNDSATNSAQKTVIILAPNNPPTAQDVNIDVQYNQTTQFGLVINDADNDTVQVTFPDDLNGAQISVVDSQALIFNYTPPSNSISSQSYTLSASDGKDTINFLLNITLADSTPATIVSVTPEGSSEPVLVDSPVSISFSDIMQTSSLVTNTSEGTCIGSIQISADSFSTCLALNVESLSGTTSDTSLYFHSVSLTATLSEDTQYSVRVTSDLVNFDNTAIDMQTVTSFTTSSQDIKITEISSVQFSNDLPWIEIYNGTGAAVNLQNYSLKTRSINTVDSSTSAETIFSLPNKELGNGEYLILQSKFGDDFLTSASVSNPKIALVGNSGDQIRPYWYINGFAEILNSAGTQTIDFVKFGNSSQEPVTPSQWQGDNADQILSEQGGSLKRELNAIDTNQSTDWLYSVFNTPAGPNNISCTVDDDEDGIPDCAEQEGTTFAGLPLYEWGARTSQKDIFIEVDYMDSSDAGITPHRTALEKIVTVFAEKGYTVHFDVGDLFDQSTNTAPQNFDLGGGNTVPFNNYTPFEYDLSSPSLFVYKMEYTDITRRPIFHYLLMANSGNEDGSISGSGIAEISGNDLMVTMGGWGLTLDTQIATNVAYNYQASTIFHELGHNLGLYHGGDEEINFKPNHLSSMNYLYQLAGLSTIGNNEGDRYYERFYPGNANCDITPNTNSHLGSTDDFIIDYSSGSSANLDESTILEAQGLNRNGSLPVDFNCNTINTESLNSFDTNQDNSISVLRDVDEWSMLNLQFYMQSAGNRFGVSNTDNTSIYKLQSTPNTAHVIPRYIKEAQPSSAIIDELKAIKEQ